MVSFVHLWDNLSNKNNKDKTNGGFKDEKKHVIVGCLLIVSSMFVSACGSSSDVTTGKTSVTKQVEATGQSTSSSIDQTKYDAIITEAKKS